MSHLLILELSSIGFDVSLLLHIINNILKCVFYYCFVPSYHHNQENKVKKLKKS